MGGVIAGVGRAWGEGEVEGEVQKGRGETLWGEGMGVGRGLEVVRRVGGRGHGGRRWWWWLGGGVIGKGHGRRRWDRCGGGGESPWDGSRVRTGGEGLLGKSQRKERVERLEGGGRTGRQGTAGIWRVDQGLRGGAGL